MIRYLDLCDDLGLTPRQADFWRTKGFISASAEGSGSTSWIGDREARVLTRMAALVNAGMRPAAAVRIARHSVERGVRAIDVAGLRIVFDVEPQQQEATA